MKPDVEDPKTVIVSILVAFCVVALLLLFGAGAREHVKTPEEKLYDYQVQHHLPGSKPPEYEDICAGEHAPAHCEAVRKAAKCEFMPGTPGCPKKSPPQGSAPYK